MRISAVICTRNRPDMIVPAVESVLVNDFPDFDLLVIDQSDTDATHSALTPLLKTFRNLAYRRVEFVGLSRARNAGIAGTASGIVAFTDDDCIVPSTWLSTIVALFDDAPHVDMLYGQVLVPPVLLKRSGIVVPALPFSTARQISKRDGFLLYGMGANFAVRRKLALKLCGFDELLGAGGPLWSGEDFDFQYRAYLAGATMSVRPEISVEHYGARDYRQWKSLLANYGKGDGAFWAKHIRCGDPLALRLCLQRFTRLSIREVLSVMGIRRRGSQLVYLRSYLAGMRASLHYEIDPDPRLYRLASRAA